ncbi:MAG: hypothetical protein V4643_12575 [Bacteroidota bacterium]
MNTIEENNFQPDFTVADKYIQFSSEILRLSLLGITAIATFLLLYLKKEFGTCFTIGNPEKALLFITLLLFTFSSGLALTHRFFATDSLAYLIAYLRKKDSKEKKGLIKNLKASEKVLIYAEYTFGFGVFAFVCVLLILICNL